MMNCETIDSLLDDHLVARLSPAERKRAADHVSGCARCSAAWAVDEALRAETIADPAPELFAALLRRTAAMPARSRTARRRRWASFAAAAAVLAVVAVAARWAVIEPEGAAPPEVSSAPSTAAASPFVAGRDYEVLGAVGRLGAPSINVETLRLLELVANQTAVLQKEAGAVEVVEFFMFECFPCYAFEADLNRWEAEKGSVVSLLRVPAMFNPGARLQARAFYTAAALGKLDAMRGELYDEIHVRENPLDSRELLADFFARFGVDRATFDATFDSSDVDARFQAAVALNREYRVQATPTMVVAGRYATDPSRAGSQMLEVVDQLVAHERRCQTRCDGLRPPQTGEKPFAPEPPR